MTKYYTRTDRDSKESLFIFEDNFPVCNPVSVLRPEGSPVGCMAVRGNYGGLCMHPSAWTKNEFLGYLERYLPESVIVEISKEEFDKKVDRVVMLYELSK